MNFFQQQLKWILGNQPEFQDAKYVGRACFVPLVDGTRIKAELITRGTHEKYEALKLTAMNKAEGQIDATILEFKDYFAAQKGSTAGAFTPHIWIYREKPEWYGAPGYTEKEELGKAAGEYVRLFTPDSIGRHGAQSVGGKGHERVGTQSAAGRADQKSLSAGYAHFVEPYGRSP